MDVGDDERVEGESANHHILSDNHLALYSLRDMFYCDLRPVRYECLLPNLVAVHIDIVKTFDIIHRFRKRPRSFRPREGDFLN